MRKHTFDPISFVFGLGFLGLAAAVALPREPWDVFFGGLAFGWIWPAAVVLAGVALLVPSLRAVRTASPPQVEQEEQED
ncbi:MAG: hypothetical protein R3246_04195 [Acidimicrobiia bacterium]|nr:hypothetical protein [Acidimicrobiia bacterium]